MSREILQRTCKNSNAKLIIKENIPKKAVASKTAPKQKSTKKASGNKQSTRKAAANASNLVVIINAIGKFIRKNIKIKKPKKFLLIDIDSESKNLLQACYDIKKYIFFLILELF